MESEADSGPLHGYETAGAGRPLPSLTRKWGAPENSTWSCASLSVSTFSTSAESRGGGVADVGTGDCFLSAIEGGFS
jgi:hypothetical protein